MPVFKMTCPSENTDQIVIPKLLLKEQFTQKSEAQILSSFFFGNYWSEKSEKYIFFKSEFMES